MKAIKPKTNSTTLNANDMNSSDDSGSDTDDDSGGCVGRWGQGKGQGQTSIYVVQVRGTLCSS